MPTLRDFAERVAANIELPPATALSPLVVDIVEKVLVTILQNCPKINIKQVNEPSLADLFWLNIYCKESMSIGETFSMHSNIYDAVHRSGRKASEQDLKDLITAYEASKNKS